MHDPHQRVLAQQHVAISLIGWAVSAIIPEPGQAPYAYTIGLTEIGAPELVITGLHHDIAYAILNAAAARVHTDGERWTHQQRLTDLFIGYDAVILDGTSDDRILPGTAHARYGARSVRLQQLVWPDPDGHFPWDTGYRYPATTQPLLQP